MSGSNSTKTVNQTAQLASSLGGVTQTVSHTCADVDFDKFSALLNWGYNLDRSGYQDAADAVYADTLSALEADCLNANSPKVIKLFAEFSKAHGEELLALNRIDWAVSAYRRALNLYQLLLSNSASFPIAYDFSMTLIRLGHLLEGALLSEQALSVYAEAAATIKNIIPFAQTPALQRELELKLDQVHARSFELLESLA